MKVNANNSSTGILTTFLSIILGIAALEMIFIVTAPPETTHSTSINPYPVNPWEARQLSSNDDFQYNNPDDTYSPSQFVQYGHKFTNKDFEVSQEYGERLLYAPIITFGLGFLAIFFLYFGLLCRCCFDCCRCLPNTESAHFERDRFCLTIFYFVLALLVLIVDQLVFLGNQSIDSGVNTFRSDVKTLSNYLNLMSADTNDLSTYATTLSSQYTAATNSCSAVQLAPDYSQDINDFKSNVNSLSDALSEVDDKITLVQDYTDTYAVFYRTLALYIIWGLAIGCVFFFIISKFCESICLTKFSIAISTITFLLYLILGVPWLLFTSGGGDLCMEPMANVIQAVPIDTVKNITIYYATCQGTSTLQADLDNGLNSLSQLNDSVQAAKTACPNDNNVQGMSTTLDQIDATGDSMVSLLGCPPLQYLLLNIINNAFCTDLYEGIFYIWGSQLVTSFLLYGLLIVSVFLYQYYEVGKIVPQDDFSDDEGEDEERGKVVQVKPKEEHQL